MAEQHPSSGQGAGPSEAGRGRGKWTQQPAALTSSPPLTSSLTSHCPHHWFSQASGSFPPQCLCTCCFLGPTGPLRWAGWASFHHAPLQMSLPREVSRSLYTARPHPHPSSLPPTVVIAIVPARQFMSPAPPGACPLQGISSMGTEASFTSFATESPAPSTVSGTQRPPQHSAEPWTRARQRPVGRNSLHSDPR